MEEKIQASHQVRIVFLCTKCLEKQTVEPGKSRYGLRGYSHQCDCGQSYHIEDYVYLLPDPIVEKE